MAPSPKLSFGEDAVALVASPVEALMRLSGRREATGVTIDGPRAVVDAFEFAKLGARQVPFSAP